MPIVAYRELTPDLAQLAPTAPVPTLVRAIRTAAREFCERSEAFRYDSQLTLVAGLFEYQPMVPTGTSVVKVVSAVYHGRPLEPTSASLLERDLPGWKSERGEPRWYKLQASGELHIAPCPAKTEVQAVDLELAVKPTLTSDGIEEWVLERFHTTILDGAISNLLSVRGTEWFDPGLAMTYAQQFAVGIEEAKGVANQDNTAKVRVTSYGGY